MARARNIKPGFFSNEELVELPFSTRLLFIGLWTLADRMGRMEDRPKRIKMDLFPADNLDVDAALNELQSSGFLLRYTVEGVKYIQVLAFDKHQNPHRDEKASTIPAPCEHHASTVQEPIEHGGNRADSLIPDSPIPDSLISEDKPIVAAVAPTARRRTDRADDAVQIFEHWQRVTGHYKSVLDAKRVNVIKARLKDGYTVTQLCQAIDGNKADPWHQGQNDRQNIVDGLHYICRDGPTVEKFIAIAERGPSNGRSANQNLTISNLQAYLNEHEN